jgi:two-component system sensor histidine kinase QseC
MTVSIRNFLLLNLLLSVVLITALNMLANFFLENKDLQNDLDNKLTESAFAIQAFISQAPTKAELQNIQDNIDTLSSLYYPFKLHTYTQHFRSPHQAFQFQVSQENSEILLTSAIPLPPTFSAAPLGLSTGTYKTKAWRIFSTIDPITKTKVIVAEQHDFRQLLSGRITQESLLIMLISYPFLGLLIWLIVGRGLSSLKRVSEEVQQRDPDRLEPINIEQVPVEIKAIVEEWNKLFVRLQEAFSREKRFAADAAHELKTPLAALKAHTQVALNASSEAERETALRKILAGVDRSAHVVQQLLTLSRVGQGLSLEPPTAVNIAKQAKEVMAELAPEALHKDTEIELISPDIEPTIQGHATAIAILVRNLVDNAIRYCPNGSFVRVIIEDHKGEVLLKVIDDGPGIPEHYRKQVFERFFRMLGNKSPGSGLGLGIVQQIVELHKAKLTMKTPASGVGLEINVSFSKELIGRELFKQPFHF